MKVVPVLITGTSRPARISEPCRVSEGLGRRGRSSWAWKTVVPAIVGTFSLGFGLGIASTFPGDPHSWARFVLGREMYQAANMRMML